MTAFELDFTQALAMFYPVGKRPPEPKLPPAWAPDATPGMDYRPGATPVQARCARCVGWAEVVVYQDDERPPRTRVCACGFEQIHIHVVHVRHPITYLADH